MRQTPLTWSEVLAPAGELVACAGVLVALSATLVYVSHGTAVMDLVRNGTLAVPMAATAVAALLVFVRRPVPRVVAAFLAAASNVVILVMRFGFGVRAHGLDALQYGTAAIAAGMTLWLFAHDRRPVDPVGPRLRPSVRR